MESVRDEMREGRGRGGRGRRWWLVGTVEQVVDVASTHLRGQFMAVVGVLGERIFIGMGLRSERKVDVPDAGDVWLTSVAGGWRWRWKWVC
jgi:hypothetical protein